MDHTVTRSSSAMMYIVFLWLPSLATCWAVQRKEGETEGTDRLRLEPPVAWRNEKLKLSLAPIGPQKVDRISLPTSSIVISEVKCTFPINPSLPSMVLNLPLGYGIQFSPGFLKYLGRQIISRSQVEIVFGFLAFPPPPTAHFLFKNDGKIWLGLHGIGELL